MIKGQGALVQIEKALYQDVSVPNQKISRLNSL